MNPNRLHRGRASALAMWFIFTAAAAAAAAQVAQTPPLSTEVAAYVDETKGTSSSELVRRALAANRSMAAAQLDVERAAARLTQASVFQNPALDVEHTTGKYTGAPDEYESAVGLAIPLELGGKRKSRIDLARAELESARALFGERQRQLITDVLVAYVDALAALRELDTTARLNKLDEETGRYLESRVREGDAAPLESELLQVEVDRLRSRRELLKGRLDAAIERLKTLAGMPPGERILFRSGISRSEMSARPATLEDAVNRALASRPDVTAARANERAAEAAVRLARSQSAPDVTPFLRFASGAEAFDETPVGKLTDQSKSIGFGVSITLPLFNRNQGGRAEAAAALRQAQNERAYLESVVRGEVASAWRRLDAADASLAIFENGVIERSTKNLETLRAAYQLGEYRITDLIAEQRRLVDSQREFTDLLAERYRAAVDLELASGNLPATPAKGNTE